MNDASKKDRKNPRRFGKSLFSHEDQDGTPDADIDVPDYEGTLNDPEEEVAPKPAEKAKETEDVPETEQFEAAKPEPTSNPGVTTDTSEADDAPKASAKDVPKDMGTPEGVEGATASAPRPRRDIYELSGRARPQRISAPKKEPVKSPKAGSATSEDAALDAGATKHQPDFADAKTEQINLGDAATASGAGAGATAHDSESEADTSAGVGPAGGAAASGAALAGAGALGGAGAHNAAEANAGATTHTGPELHDGHGLHGGAGTPGEVDPNTGEALATDPAAPGAAGATDAAATDPVAIENANKRGTQSFGLALLRIVAGAVLLVTGLQTLFGVAGDPGISALESRFGGLNGAGVLAIAVPTVEVVAGGLLILGLLTPFAAAAAFVVSAFMATFHLAGTSGSLWPYGLNPVVHQWALYALISLSLVFTGPGRAALDRSRGWATRPLASAWIFAAIGIVGFAGLWLVAGGGNPLR